MEVKTVGSRRVYFEPLRVGGWGWGRGGPGARISGFLDFWILDFWISRTSWSRPKCRRSSVAYGDQVVPQLLCDDRALLGGHRLGVQGDDDGLHRLDQVQPPRPLLRPHHLVVGGDVHVPGERFIYYLLFIKLFIL